MSRIDELAARASAVLGALAEADWTALRDGELCSAVARVEEAGRLIDAARSLSAAEVDRRSAPEFGADGLARRHGHRRPVHLIEELARVSQGEAARRIRAGAALSPRPTLLGSARAPERPALAGAVRAGQVDADAATVIIRCLAEAERGGALPELIAESERALVVAARSLSADLVAVQARAHREALDPDGALPREEALRRRRGLWLGRERDGLTTGRIVCDPASAALLRAALSERTGPARRPRFLAMEGGLAAEGAHAVGGCGGSAVPTAAGGEDLDGCTAEAVLERWDPRTTEQRHLDVLIGLLTAGIRADESGAGSLRSLTTVMAVATEEALESGRGHGRLVDGLEPVSAATMRELACDAGTRPIQLGSDGEVLRLGRRRRTFNGAQRRALAVRDGGCIWPRCTAPPSWCHAHHVEEWHRGGRTDIDNGALLCAAHHHMLHAGDFRLRMRRGRPELLAPPDLDPERRWRRVGRPLTPVVAAVPVVA